jgi:hypothetical protein
MTDPTPTTTPLPAAPDWRALCKELRDDLENVYLVMAVGAGETQYIAPDVLLRADAALATPPAPPLEPRGCPLPGACSCPTAPIVPPELIQALVWSEAALADIGDAEREPGDDLAWAERRAAEELPRIRRVLQTWRNYATPPAATREAVEPTYMEVVRLRDELDKGYGVDLVVFARAVLARWGGAAVQPVPVSKRPPEANDTIHPTGECWWFEPHTDGWRWLEGAWYFDTYQGNYTHWLPHWALPVPAADKGERQS